MHFFKEKNRDCIYTVDSCNFNSLIDTFEVLNVALPQPIDPLSLQNVNSKQIVESNRQLNTEYCFANQIHPNGQAQRNSFLGSSKFKITIIVLLALTLLVLVFILIVGLLLALSKFNSNINSNLQTNQSTFLCYSSTYSVILNKSTISTCSLSNSFTGPSTNNNNNLAESCSLSYTIEKTINLSYLRGDCNRNGLIYDEFTITNNQIYLLKHCSWGKLCNNGSQMINTFSNSSELICKSSLIYSLPNLTNNNTVTQCYSCSECLNSSQNIENCSTTQKNLCQYSNYLSLTDGLTYWSGGCIRSDEYLFQSLTNGYQSKTFACQNNLCNNYNHLISNLTLCSNGFY